MELLTKKESEVLLTLFKDFNTDYNANSISKPLCLTPRGALKILKNLKKHELLNGKQLGKAVFYKVNFNDEYAVKLISVLLMNESREKASRWLSEFKELFEPADIVIVFGSIVRNPNAANDIDLLIVFKKEKYKAVNQIIEKRRAISSKAIHTVKQTPQDLVKNLKKKDKVILNIIKRGYVLHGYEKLVEAMKNVTRFQ